jgi:hypothetical protein
MQRDTAGQERGRAQPLSEPREIAPGQEQERRGLSAPNLSPLEAEKQALEFREAQTPTLPEPKPAPGAEREGLPAGSTPWKPLSADAEAAAAFTLAAPSDGPQSRRMFDTTAYGAPVIHEY